MAVETDGVGDPRQHSVVADVFGVQEVGAEQRLDDVVLPFVQAGVADQPVGVECVGRMPDGLEVEGDALALSGLDDRVVEFRGALQPWLGYVAASLLFGLAHFVPRRELWPWTGFAVLAGFGLGWLFEATGNLVAPVVAHIGVNGINLRRLTRDLGPV